MLAAALSRSLKLIRTGDRRRERLAALIARLKSGVRGLPWRLRPSDTPIQPLMVGSHTEAVRLSEGLLARDILVPAIRPPTLPAATAGLRIWLPAALDEADVDRLLAALHEIAGGD